MSEQTCTCLSRADGIGASHGHHDAECPCSFPEAEEVPEPQIVSGGESLSVLEIMQRFRQDGSCEQIIKDALVRVSVFPSVQNSEDKNSVGGWQPIETAPKDGTKVLVLCRYPSNRLHAQTAVYSQQGWVSNLLYGSGSYKYNPIGWMPLPALADKNSVNEEQDQESGKVGKPPLADVEDSPSPSQDERCPFCGVRPERFGDGLPNMPFMVSHGQDARVKRGSKDYRCILDGMTVTADKWNTRISNASPEAVRRAAQKIVDAAYRDRGQVPHKDTIAQIISTELRVSQNTENDSYEMCTCGHVCPTPV